MKVQFLHTITLCHYLPGTRFRLQTDASDVGVSGVLYKIDQDGNARIVSLISRVLTRCEQPYTVTEKELLAIIYSVLKFRTYL